MKKVFLSFLFISLTIISCKNKQSDYKSKDDTSIISNKNIKTNSDNLKSNNKESENNFYDPDGYYIPAIDIEYKGYSISSFLVNSSDKKDEFGNNKINFIQVILTNLKTGKELHLKANKFSIKDFKLEFNLKSTNIGNLKFNGIYLIKKGPLSDVVTENETIVMKGTLEINDDFKKEINFKWFGGD